MTDDEQSAEGDAEQDRTIIEEARLAQLQADEAVQRVQDRIERLAQLSEALDQPKDDDDTQEQNG
jgi:hypothetical protein